VLVAAFAGAPAADVAGPRGDLDRLAGQTPPAAG
jgi:hypothetical protein